MINIVQLNVTANWGSTGVIAEGISQKVVQEGWNSHIAYGRYMNSSSANLIKVGSKWDIYRHYAINKIFDKEGLGSKNATTRLIKRLREIQPDIIHLHNIHDHWLNYPILFDYLYTIDSPVVWTFHDCWPFTGGCPHFVEYKCEKWQKDCKECQLKRSLISRSEKNLRLKIESLQKLGPRLKIISVSHWLDSMVGKSLLKDLDHSIIYNGVDTDIFKPEQNLLLKKQLELEDKIVILGVSSVWHNAKGLQDYYQLNQLLDGGCQLVLVGMNEKQIKDLPKGIIGLTRTSDVKTLVKYYSMANAVISLSRAETFGLTLIEGQACGIPSIGYETTATNELIDDLNGYKFKPGDIEGIARVINTTDWNKQFSSEEIRNNVVKNFNKERQMGKYIELYKELL